MRAVTLWRALQNTEAERAASEEARRITAASYALVPLKELSEQDQQLVSLHQQLDAAQREIAGLRSQVACLERQLAESDEATKRAWREAGRAEG